jgi:hypothetical protein
MTNGNAREVDVLGDCFVLQVKSRQAQKIAAQIAAIKQHSFCKIVRFGFGFFVFTLRLSVR